MAANNECGKVSATGLLSLPVELRECIYEHYLANLVPTTFIIAKDPRRPHWALTTRECRRAPVLLLTCKTISAEFHKLMSSRISSGQADSVPLTRGPTMRIEPRRSGPVYSNVEEGGRTIERAFLPETLASILCKSAPSMRLHLVMPQTPQEALLFTYMLRFVVAICNARTLQLRHICIVRDPISGPGWGVDINAVAEEVSKIRCESMEWENWYRPWYASSPVTADGEASRDSASVRTDLSIEEAWEAVLQSCREYEQSLTR